MSIAMGATVMMTFLTFHFISYHRDMMAMIKPRYRDCLQAKKQWEQNRTTQNVNSDEVFGQVGQVLPSLILVMRKQRLKTLEPLVEKQVWKRMLATKVALSA